MHARDRLDGLGAHLVADPDRADEDKPARRQRPVCGNLPLVDGERQNADGTRGKAVDRRRDRRGIRQRLLPAALIVVGIAEREELFRRALGERHIVCARDLGQGVFILAVEGHRLTDRRVHLRAGARDEAEDRALRRVAADRLSVVDNGARIVAHAQIDKVLQPRAQLRIGSILPARAVNEGDRLKLPLRDRARLVTEEDVQAARRLNPRDLANEDVVLQHLAHVLR